MLLTATCTYADAQDIRASLEIPSENFSIVRGSSFERKEITIEVYKRKDNRQNFSNDVRDLIKKYEMGKIIIYCATQSGCNDLFNHFCQIIIWAYIMGDWKMSNVKVSCHVGKMEQFK